jgi:hypothetical protein
MLMPTNCWKIARPMPVQTIGRILPLALSIRSDSLGRWASTDSEPRISATLRVASEIDCGGDDLHPEHPAPCRIVEPEQRGRRPCDAREIPVGDECAGQAGDDHDLLDARKPTADVRGDDFGDVDRGEHAGRTDAEAADDAGEHEHGCRSRRTRCECADDEQHRGDHHDVAAAEIVGKPPGHERADRRADQDRADGKARAERR